MPLAQTSVASQTARLQHPPVSNRLPKSSMVIMVEQGSLRLLKFTRSSATGLTSWDCTS